MNISHAPTSSLQKINVPYTSMKVYSLASAHLVTLFGSVWGQPPSTIHGSQCAPGCSLVPEWPLSLTDSLNFIMTPTCYLSDHKLTLSANNALT